MGEGTDQHVTDITSTIIAECEQLDYKQRMRYMVDTGKQARTDPATRRALDVLHRGSLYEQLLALQSCYGSHDPTTPVLALSSRSSHIRKRASRLAALAGPDEELFDALTKISPREQWKLLYRLKSYERIELIDRFIDSFASFEKPLVVKHCHRCLQFASARKMTSYLDSVSANPGVGLIDAEWVALARAQPQTVLEPFYRIMIRDTPSKGQDVSSWVATINRLLPLFRDVHNTEHSAMDLVRIVLQRDRSARLECLETLARTHHEALAKLLLDYDAARIPSFGWASRKLSVEILLKLATKSLEEASGPSGSGLLNSRFMMSSWVFLTPAQKVKLYNASPPQSVMNHISASCVEDLPQSKQILHARSQIGYLASQTSTTDPIHWISFMPWDEAIELQQEYLMSSDATTRAHAAQQQIAAAGRRGGDRFLYQRAIELVIRKRNEQDSVRSAMLQALCAFPSRSWNREHFPGLEQIMSHALNANDLSGQSSHRLAVLAANMLSVDPAWAWEQMMVIYAERGINTSTNPLVTRPTASLRQSLAALAAAALPTLKKWQDNEQQSDIFWLAATFFQHHLDIFPELEEALIGLSYKILASNEDHLLHLLLTFLKYSPRLTEEYLRLLDTIESEQFASAILRVLLKDCPLATRIRIMDLIAEDPTWIACEPVRSYLINYRQDMLTPYLTSTKLQGRFNNNRALLYIRIQEHDAFKLTSHQQSLVADEMTRRLSDGSQRAQALKFDLRLLSYLHLIDSERLASFTEDERPLVRKFAIGNLNHLDSGKGFGKLRECLADGRARYAIYSLGSVLTTVPAAEALTVLKATSLASVTVAKEIIRRVAELLTEEGFDYLLELDHRDLHFDVRVALITNLCLHYRDRKETWQVLIKAARGEAKLAVEIAPLVVTQAHKVLDSSATELMQTLLEHTVHSVRVKVLRHLAGHRIRDLNETLFPQVDGLLGSTYDDEAFAAAQVIFTCYRSQVDSIIKFFTGLADTKQLDRALDHYRYVAKTDKAGGIQTTMALLDFLRQGRLNTGRQLDVIFDCLPWEDMADKLFSIAPKLHADALVKAEGIIVSCTRTRGQNDDAELDRLEDKLRCGESEQSRRLGLAALQAVTRDNHHVHDRGGWGRLWTKERRERLRVYREDESVMVAEAASNLVPPGE